MEVLSSCPAAAAFVARKKGREEEEGVGGGSGGPDHQGTHAYTGVWRPFGANQVDI
jgi:hypothetical protein